MSDTVSFSVLFALAGLRRGSKSWVDYKTGKSVLPALPSKDYERALIELLDYLCL